MITVTRAVAAVMAMITVTRAGAAVITMITMTKAAAATSAWTIDTTVTTAGSPTGRRVVVDSNLRSLHRGWLMNYDFLLRQGRQWRGLDKAK